MSTKPEQAVSRRGRCTSSKRRRSGGPADVADPEAWTLRLDAHRPRGARRRAGAREGARAPTPSNSGGRLPARPPGGQARRHRRRPAQRPRLRADRHARRRPLRGRGPDPPVLGHRAAPGRALGAEQARPRARRRDRPGQDGRRPHRPRQRARRHRARLPHRRVRPGRPALPAHGAHRVGSRAWPTRWPSTTRWCASAPSWPPRSTSRCPTTRGASRRRARPPSTGAGVHRARREALRPLHPAVHPGLAAPPRRARA